MLFVLSVPNKAFIQTVILLNVIMLNATMLNIVVLNAAILNVVAPGKQLNLPIFVRMTL